MEELERVLQKHGYTIKSNDDISLSIRHSSEEHGYIEDVYITFIKSREGKPPTVQVGTHYQDCELNETGMTNTYMDVEVFTEIAKYIEQINK